MKYYNMWLVLATRGSFLTVNFCRFYFLERVRNDVVVHPNNAGYQTAVVTENIALTARMCKLR